MPQRSARPNSKSTTTARAADRVPGAPPAPGHLLHAIYRLRYLGTHPVLVAAICAAIIGASVGIFGFSGWSLGVPVVVLAAVIALGVAHPRIGLFYPVITHGPRDGKQVALSFDDGPDPDTTPRVLDALARHDARATFFVIGRKLAEQPELARRILAEGHDLGNHSWQHSRFQNFRGTRFQQREIERGAQAIAAAGRDGLPLYRPPMGQKTPHLAHAARRLGLRSLVTWSLHARDTRRAKPEHIARRVLRKVRAGDIILLHDGHDLASKSRPACAEATALILEGLDARGLESVSLPELLQQSDLGVRPDCYRKTVHPPPL